MTAAARAVVALAGALLLTATAPVSTPAQQTAVYRALELEDAARWEEAAAVYRSEIWGPESVQAAFGLERALLTLGRGEELAEVLSELVRARRADDVIRGMYVRTLLHLERRDAARAFVEDWIEAHPLEPEAYRQLYAISPVAPGDARKLWRGIRAHGGSDSARTIADELAERVLAAGLWNVGREILEDRYARDRRSETAEQLALAAARAGDVDRARRVAREAGLVAESPALGWLALYAGDLVPARRLLARAEDADAAAILPLAVLSRTSAVSAPVFGDGVLRLARGDTVAAARAFAGGAQEAVGAESLLLIWAARLHAERRNGAAAASLYEAVARDYPQSPEAPEAVLAQARLLAQLGRADAAADRFEHLILHYPASALVPAARRELGALRGRLPPAS
ncbi:hypothetical protein BH23GEM2_BH23GEM2_07080 [soil metagenome]